MHFFLSLLVCLCVEGMKRLFVCSHTLSAVCRYRWCITVVHRIVPLSCLCFDYSICLAGSEAYICLFMQPNTMSKHTSSSSSSSSSQKLSALVWLYSTMCHLNVRIVKNHNGTMNSSSKSTIFTIGLWILMMSAMQAKTSEKVNMIFETRSNIVSD